jgi:hypothetical protein
MDPAFADFLSSFANALAAIAVLAALCAAVVEGSDSNKPEISPAVPYLAALGIVIYLAARALKYLVAGA